MEISFLNNIKKYNSNTNKKNIVNVMNEAMRESEEYKNNVNKNLTSQNIVLEKNFEVLREQFEETEVSNNSKDVVSVVSTIHCKEFEAQNNVDLTYLLKEKKWKEYYKKNLEFLKEKFGKNAKLVYASLHFDEATPHLHTMFTFSEKNEKNNEINYEKVKSALTSAFARYNKKELHLIGGTKEYKKAFEEFKQKNEQKIIEKQLAKNKKKEIKKKYKYETNTSALNRDFYKTVNQDFVDYIENSNELQEIKQKIELISNEDCNIVVKRTEKTNVFEDLDKNKKSMKEKIKIFENKIENNIITEKEKEIYKMMLSKQSLIEEKKNIKLEDYLNKFEELEAQCKVLKKNKNINDFKQKTKDFISLKRITETLNNNKSKKMFEKDLQELEKNIKSSVDLQKIQELEEKVKELVKNEDYMAENEKLKKENEKNVKELKTTKNELEELKKELSLKKNELSEANNIIKQIRNVSFEELKKIEIEKIKNNQNKFEEIKAEAKQNVVKSTEAKMYQKVSQITDIKNKEITNLTKEINTLKNQIESLKVRKKEFEEDCKNISSKEVEKIKEKIVRQSFTIDNFFEFLNQHQQQKLAFEEEMREYIKKIMKHQMIEEYNNLKYIFEKLVENICYEENFEEYFNVEKLIENFVENDFRYINDTQDFIFYLKRNIKEDINQNLKTKEKNHTQEKINNLKNTITKSSNKKR